MTGHPRYGAPDTLMVKLCNRAYQSTLAAEIGAQWGNFSPGGPVISKFRRNLYSFGEGGTLQTRMQTSRVGRSMQRRWKEGEGRRTGKVPCRWEEGSGTELWVCLVLWTLEGESSRHPSVPTGSHISKNRVGQGWASPVRV